METQLSEYESTSFEWEKPSLERLSTQAIWNISLHFLAYIWQRDRESGKKSLSPGD